MMRNISSADKRNGVGFKKPVEKKKTTLLELLMSLSSNVPGHFSALLKSFLFTQT